ncbi:MAG: transposase, partial [Tannerella sp.]|nr:transposase [Tannerella sp.]
AAMWVKKYKVASLPFTQFLEDRRYRLVIMGEKSDDRQADLFYGDNCIYRCILTNDWDSTEQEVIEYYNQRESSEKIFDIQNNDFGWGHLPCSDMHHNTVYLILTAMIKNFYNYIVRKVSKVFTDILPTSRLKRFIFRFICVPGRWYYRSRQWTLGLYTDRPYEKLFA